MERGYFVIDKQRRLQYQYIVTGLLLKNQTATLLIEIDKMTGKYTGNPDDYTAGGLLVTHADQGPEVGNHAADFVLQAQCGADITLYSQLALNKKGLVLVSFGGPSSDEAGPMFSDLLANLAEFKARGFGVVALDDSPPKKNMAFASSLGVVKRDIIFFTDRRGTVGRQYGLYRGAGCLSAGRHETAYLIIDKAGVIRYKHKGGMLENQSATLLAEIDKLSGS